MWPRSDSRKLADRRRRTEAANGRDREGRGRSPSRASGACIRRRPGTRRHVALPAARDHDPATLHQEAIAHVYRRVRVRAGSEDGAGGAVEVWHGDRVAAIDDVEQDTATAFARSTGRRIDTSELQSTRPSTLRGARVHVGDAPIGRVTRIDREVTGAPSAPRRGRSRRPRREIGASSQGAAQPHLEAGHRHGWESRLR